MDSFQPRERYETVSEAEEDIEQRIAVLLEEQNWLDSPINGIVIPKWTDALTSFSAKSTVTFEDSIALEQIKQLYQNTRSELHHRAELMGSGKMSTLDESHVLFIVLFRDLQRNFVGRANMNPHKLRVLLDDRYSVE